MENVKESDLDEGRIRKLNVESLKKLVKWKKIKGDEKMPTLKNELATRLIATMGRQSPRPSPYNSDEEDDMDNEDGFDAEDGDKDEAAADRHGEEDDDEEDDDKEDEAL